MDNQPNKLNIELVDHMGYYIPKSDVVYQPLITCVSTPKKQTV
jgi:hypothetical protein